jgi:probable rRNA maturation factor
VSNTPDSSRREPLTPPSTLVVEVVIDDSQLDSPQAAAIDSDRLRQAIRAAAGHREFRTGRIGIRVTGDAEIRQVNQRFLDHDYATDVISFSYHAVPPQIEGEMVVSAETAQRQAARVGWAAEDELTLYAVHGTLHLSGLDDRSPAQRDGMRRAEQAVMRGLGITGIDRCGADRTDVQAGEPIDPGPQPGAGQPSAERSS